MEYNFSGSSSLVFYTVSLHLKQLDNVSLLLIDLQEKDVVSVLMMINSFNVNFNNTGLETPDLALSLSQFFVNLKVKF